VDRGDRILARGGGRGWERTVGSRVGMLEGYR